MACAHLKSGRWLVPDPPKFFPRPISYGLMCMGGMMATTLPSRNGNGNEWRCYHVRNDSGLFFLWFWPVVCRPLTPAATSDKADAFDAHFEAHRCKRCDQCKYVANRPARELVAALRTWLQPQLVDLDVFDWWLGCSACEHAAASAGGVAIAPRR